MLNRGDNVSGFAVLDEVGRGGMATVYRARQTDLDREVALKVLSPHLATDDRLVARFQREARAAASLSHPNIVPIYTVGSHGGLHYFVMKLVDGHTLADTLAAQVSLSMQEVTALMQPVCSAAQHAHDSGVVHRDLKPSNILIATDGHPYVTDFGVAKVLEASGLTETGLTLGTAHYMAPEQVLGHDVDRRADVYSLGVVAFHMLTGTVPFDGETPYAIALGHVQSEPPSLDALAPHVPEAVGAVIRRAMAKAPEDRPESAEAFSRDLTAACNGTDMTVREWPPVEHAGGEGMLAFPLEAVAEPPMTPTPKPPGGPVAPIAPQAPDVVAEARQPVDWDGLMVTGAWPSALLLLICGLVGLVTSTVLLAVGIGAGAVGAVLAMPPLVVGVLLLASAAARSRRPHGAGRPRRPSLAIRGRWPERGLAKVIDLLLFTIPTIALYLFAFAAVEELLEHLGVPLIGHRLVGELWLPASLVTNGLYYALLGMSGRQTLGKRLIGLRVTGSGGCSLGRTESTRRMLWEFALVGLGGLLWGAGLLDYAWPLWDPDGNALHDHLSRTRVVRASHA